MSGPPESTTGRRRYRAQEQGRRPLFSSLPGYGGEHPIVLVVLATYSRRRTRVPPKQNQTSARPVRRTLTWLSHRRVFLLIAVNRLSSASFASRHVCNWLDKPSRFAPAVPSDSQPRVVGQCTELILPLPRVSSLIAR